MKKIFMLGLSVLFLLSGLAFGEQKGKICVATQEKSAEAAVSDKAAQAPFFLIFDEKGNLVEALDNPLLKGRHQEVGKLMVGFLADKGVTAVIGKDYCGDIIGILKNKGITAYNFEGSAAEAVARVVQGQVPEALPENAAVANHKALTAAGKGKIAVAANGQTSAAPISVQAGGAAFFLIFDKEGKWIETLANPEKNGATPGPAAVDFLAGKGATVIVAEGFGPKIVEVMKGKGIRAVAFKGTAEEAVKNFLQIK
jgi:predicted Fe-Mo cluster-binding NifX family protein